MCVLPCIVQYLGNHTTDRVKSRCIEILYSWSQCLKHEPKINEAYQMLKRQGIVKQDPTYTDRVRLPCIFYVYMYMYTNKTVPTGYTLM